MKPQYQEGYIDGHAVVQCIAFSRVLFTVRIEGPQKQAMADAKREAKGRMKYCLSQAKAL